MEDLNGKVHQCPRRCSASKAAVQDKSWQSNR
jgi:hypothetical protein